MPSKKRNIFCADVKIKILYILKSEYYLIIQPLRGCCMTSSIYYVILGDSYKF
jgi:hypothetical protein